MIDAFRDNYSFLSNFYIVSEGIIVDSIKYRSIEHAYQASKSLKLEDRYKIQSFYSPGKAKRYGSTIELRPDWESIKKPLMLNLVRLKFTIPRFTTLLLQTDTVQLVEGNTWHDNFWGICYCSDCKGIGKNWLGKILMYVRDELR